MVDVIKHRDHPEDMKARLAKRDRTSADVKNADHFHEHRPGVQVKTTAIHRSRNPQWGKGKEGEGNILGGSRDGGAKPTLPPDSRSILGNK